jgi:hypothetical protein
MLRSHGPNQWAQGNSLFAQQPYEPSDGFFAVRTIWLSDGMTFERVHLLSLLCMYSGCIQCITLLSQHSRLESPNSRWKVQYPDDIHCSKMSVMAQQFVFERELDTCNNDENF